MPEPAPVEEDGPLSALIRDYLQHMSVERGLSVNTLAAYRRDLRRYEFFLRTRSVRDAGGITRHDVSAFAQAVVSGEDGFFRLSPRSAARTIVAVRGLHRFWALEGITDGDPARDVHPPMTGQRLPKAIPVADVVTILETVDTSMPAGQRDRALLEFLYSTGARISEAVGLDVDDVSVSDALDGPAVVRLTGKGSKERLVRRRLSRQGQTGARLEGQGKSGALPQHAGRTPQPPECLEHPQGGDGACGDHPGRLAAHAAPLLRDPSPRGRG
jgi:integrase/recombinase XerD